MAPPKSSHKSLPSSSSSSSAAAAASQRLIKQITEYENQVKSSQNQDLNPIADLLEPLSNYVRQTGHPEDPSISPQVIHALIYSLHRIFSSLIRQGRIHGSLPENQKGAVKVVKDWLKDRYHEYVHNLISLLRLPVEPGTPIELDSLTILMNLVRCESDIIRSLKSQDQLRSSDDNDNAKYPSGGFDSPTFLKIVKALLEPLGDGEADQVLRTVRVEFILRYLNFCDDIRYRFLNDANLICQSYNPAVSKSATHRKTNKGSMQMDSSYITRNLLVYLESISTMPTDVEELNQFWTGKPIEFKQTNKRKKSKTSSKFNKKSKIENEGSTGVFDDPIESDEEDHSNYQPVQIKQSKIHPLLSLRSHQKVFSECWISFLSLVLSESEIKRVLKILHDQVIPHLIEPKILMDFLVDCIDCGGAISILSLNALFTLMTKHNLDYPDFYTRLYCILDSTALHTRYRPRLFRMLEVFLSSTHLPVNIIASFIKKLARLCLFAPPGAIIAIVPFCYNVIKRHPSSMAMLHRTVQPSIDLKTLELADPFSVEESDPSKTNAIFSSLWEFSGLRSHYLSTVSTLFKVFHEAFDKPKYDLEDFLDHTYSSLIETEFNRPIKKSPALSILSHSINPDHSLLSSNHHSNKTDSSSTLNPIIPNDILNQIWKI